MGNGSFYLWLPEHTLIFTSVFAIMEKKNILKFLKNVLGKVKTIYLASDRCTFQ